MESAPPDPHRAVVATPASLLGARDRRVTAHSPLQGPAACTRVRERRSNAQLMRTIAVCADLPAEVLGQRVLAHPDVDPAARLALFRACHALARTVLLHGPGTKRRTTEGDAEQPWSAALAHLLGDKWQPLPPGSVDLELCITSSVDLGSAAPQPHLPPPPPASVSQHVAHLHLRQCHLTVPDLHAWQLHDAALWPHLQHLTIEECVLPQAPPGEAQPLPAIPHLDFLTWLHRATLLSDVTALLPLVSNARRLHVAGMENAWQVSEEPALPPQLPHLTHVDLDLPSHPPLTEALLRHPTLAHVAVRRLDARSDLGQLPCRWRTLDVSAASLGSLARLPLGGLERLTVRGAFTGSAAAGLALLQRLHAGGRLVLLPWDGRDRPARAQLPSDGRCFRLWLTAGCTPALLRLVLEAGQGVSGLDLDVRSATLPALRDQLAPLLQQHGRIDTLHVDLTIDLSPDALCAGLLGALPACVTHVEFPALGDDFLKAQHVKALVQGGLASLAHPVQLTLAGLRDAPGVSARLEAQVTRLAAGGGSVDGRQLLTVEVVR